MVDSPRTASPFFPLQLLVLFLGVWMGYHVFELNEERLGAEQRIQQVLPQANAALEAKKRLIALAKDIDDLSVKDATAAQIVSEFKIRGQNPPESDTSSGAK